MTTNDPSRARAGVLAAVCALAFAACGGEAGERVQSEAKEKAREQADNAERAARREAAERAKQEIERLEQRAKREVRDNGEREIERASERAKREVDRTIR